MASVMPKVSLYLFLSVICLMFNLSIFFVTLIDNETGDINALMGEDAYTKYTDKDMLIKDDDVSIGNFLFATGGSFIPFFSLIPIATLGESLPVAMTVITGMILGIIGFVQVFLLAIIILNLAPKILGSGFDV